MPEYDQGVLQADVAKETGVKFILWSTLPYVGPDFMGLGGVELYDCELSSLPLDSRQFLRHAPQRRREPTIISNPLVYLLFSSQRPCS